MSALAVRVRTEASAAAVPAHHLCAAVEGPDARQSLACAFLLRGLERRQRLVHVADRRRHAAVHAALACAGARPDALVASGRLLLREPGDLYVERGRFAPERALAQLRQAAARARADGLAGLRVAADMSWTATAEVEWASLVGYERSVNALFTSGTSVALCQYDPGLTPGATLEELLATHPIAQRARSSAPSPGAGVAPALALAGELDFAAVRHLEVALREYRPACGDYHVDLRDLEFIDVGGLRGLLQAAAGQLDGGRLVLHEPPPLARRMLRVLGWDRLPWVVVGGPGRGAGATALSL